MRQSLLFRLVGALLVPLYAMGGWIAPALQVCPMHGSPAAAHVMAQMGASAANAHATGQSTSDAHMLAGHGMPAESATDAVGTAHDASIAPSMMLDGAPTSTHTHGCDCLGCCASTNGPAVPATTLVAVAGGERNTVHVEMQDAGAVVTRTPHVLPFATAPPSTLV